MVDSHFINNIKTTAVSQKIIELKISHSKKKYTNKI